MISSFKSLRYYRKELYTRGIESMSMLSRSIFLLIKLNNSVRFILIIIKQIIKILLMTSSKVLTKRWVRNPIPWTYCHLTKLLFRIRVIIQIHRIQPITTWSFRGIALGQGYYKGIRTFLSKWKNRRRKRGKRCCSDSNKLVFQFGILKKK